jgi:hypothetical protein
MKLSLLLGAIAALGLAASAQAATVSFAANNGAATADLDLTGTTLTIKLTNTTATANTDGATDLLVGLQLVPSISGAGFALTSQTAAQQFHFTNSTTGSIVNGPFTNLNWVLSTSPNGLYFGGFGNGANPIIGEAAGGTTYANAGSSLTSGPHGDYNYKSATFVISTPAGFSLTAISSATFLFNTDGSTTVPGTPGGGPRPVPLPAAAWAGLSMLGGMGLLKLRKRA